MDIHNTLLTITPDCGPTARRANRPLPAKETYFFLDGVCPVNKWQALVDIVKAFVDGGKPGYALAAIVVMCGPIALFACATLLKIVWK